MKLRKAQMMDLETILAILKDGRDQLAERGIDQWQGDYPSKAQIVSDIQNGFAYLATSDDQETVGAISIVDAPDHAYDQLEGDWQLETDHYVVIHRVAIHSQHAGKGYATQLLTQVIEAIKPQRQEVESIRIDTHEDNLAMQHLIAKVGFQRVGQLNGVYRQKEISYVYELVMKA